MDLLANRCFEVVREPSLDIALSSNDALQEALSAAKHGVKLSKSASPISVRDVQYGPFAGVKTIAVHTNSTRYLSEHTWYSRCNVYVSDVLVRIERKGTGAVLHVSKDSLDLYTLSRKTLCTAINTMMKNRELLLFVRDTSDELLCEVSDYPCNVLQLTVREGTLNCSPRDWKVLVTGDAVYTVFRGNRFAEVYEHCDATLSTDASITVSYVGKVHATSLYAQHLSGSNHELHVALLMSSSDGRVRDYSNMCDESPLKALTIREQIHHLLEMAVRNDEDHLLSRESRLMVGGVTSTQR
jgi:hypothetical protein